MKAKHSGGYDLRSDKICGPLKVAGSRYSSAIQPNRSRCNLQKNDEQEKLQRPGTPFLFAGNIETHIPINSRSGGRAGIRVGQPSRWRLGQAVRGGCGGKLGRSP